MNTVTAWGEDIARRLLDETLCPVCASARLVDGCCSFCGADLRGEPGDRVWSASEEAARALRARDAMLRGVPRVTLPPLVASPPAPVAPAPPRPAPARPAPEDSTSLQSVLAVAGAGLFGIAAVVFTFLNPDLTDRALRSGIVALITLVFLAASLLLARRGLRFSAEAIGALGLVFVGIDVWAFAQLGGSPQDTWLLAALAAGVAGAVLTAGGMRARIRSWRWGGIIALSAVPAMTGYAAGDPLGAAIGHLGTAFLAAALLGGVKGLGPFDRRTLTALQLAAVLSAPVIALVQVLDDPHPARGFAALALVFAFAAVNAALTARHALPGLWSFLAGGAAVSAIVFAGHAVEVASVQTAWWPAVIATVAACAFGAIALAPAPGTVRRVPLAIGALVLPALIAAVPLLFAITSGLGALGGLAADRPPSSEPERVAWPFLVALVGIAVVLVAFGRLAVRRAELRVLALATDAVAVLAAAAALFAFACLPLLPLAVRVDAALVLTVLAAEIVRRTGAAGTRVTGSLTAMTVLVAVHGLLLAIAAISWTDPVLAPLAGIGVLAVLAVIAAATPRAARFVHAGAGFGYALVCVGAALGSTALSPVAVQCLTTSAGLVTAIAATFLRWIGPRTWYAVLAVTAVPFVIGIAQVLVERSGWTALSTALVFALCLALLLTRRPGLTATLRIGASALLVPALAVVVLCLGAQLLATSGSPVVLPVIAVVVAAALSAGEPIARGLLRAGRDRRTADGARIAIEASALLTGAIAVALALVREAAGPVTTMIVLVILGAGGVVTALAAHRRYGWWLAGAAFTGALWCVWGVAGVTLLEAHLLPPAIGAALVGAVLVLRGAPAVPLYATGLGIAVLPSLFLSVSEMDAPGAGPWRPLALLAGAWLLVGLGALCGRSTVARPLRIPAFVSAGVAAAAGPVLGLRMGLGSLGPDAHSLVLFALCAGAGLVSAGALALAAAGIREAAPDGHRVRSSRWTAAPAFFALVLSCWTAIERDWGSIWAMWALTIVLLIVMLVAAVRGGSTLLPPVWFLFALAFVTAVVAWSPRDLRVEWFSLPLGAFLVAAGVAGLRRRSAARTNAPAAFDEWPAGVAGSWPLLAPGIVVTMSASVVATFTDPLTWRAVLVMVLALLAILIGAIRRLAAPFVLGLIVLPVENVFVFTVQIGRGIASMPWWITLAVVGAVLLILAVTYERRGGAVGARMGDLR
ncbi:SCO7613 C-terminal domain-containing membrane protein [Microbacterium tumbae]